MAKLVIILACVALFHAVAALECYTCDGDQCKEAQEKWQKGTCGKSADPNHEPVCQKVSYKDKAGKDMIKRSCALAPKTGDIICPTIDGATDVKCPTCKVDLCNSASNISLSFTVVAGMVLASLGLKYLL
ncbi:uncharacterized protein [Leptinotarsa decemlineata]|uniref:uncharacterized protein n=1 Tax=Leptinotarsa decemlineata TaxID=7539 RepID=UPI000C253B8D|nr:uncharacterized protein LOC111510183 [Leptinotarsa decemlineata]